ncbi:dihydrofolate reductase family protein [Rubritalea tangerina]|uniref:Dihydrofolate reductase family protein n=1 Tax=Rubritalea tangerina TaxID=430798 RepID=A0ABW4Z7Q8_9BACT
MANFVYIAASLDGYIATEDGGVEWLDCVPNPEGSDLGFAAFMERVDALLMGRNTFEKVVSFGVWPYEKPVFVLSASLKQVPEGYEGKVDLVSGALAEVIGKLEGKGFKKLYVDGGKLIQSLLREDRVDRLIVSRIPVLLGSGISLFGELSEPLHWQHIKSDVLLGEIVKSEYLRKR